MRSTTSEPVEDPDLIHTLPATEPSGDASPAPSDTWDSEAPTAVHSRRPLFAGPPRLPNT
ncbi:MAG: hypothetical protein ABW061_23745 [Polyangiaceae bacterium]